MPDRARLDLSAPVLTAVTGWIARHRRRPGAQPGQRAATVHSQVTLLLRWLRHRLDLRTLALQAAVGIATGHRSLPAGLEVIAGHAPDRAHVIAEVRRAGVVLLCLDGTLIPTGRVAARVAVTGKPAHHLWFSGTPEPSAAPCRSSATTLGFRYGSPTCGPGRPST